MDNNYKNPEQIDEIMRELIDHYLTYENNKYDNIKDPKLIKYWEILKDLYDQGGPKKVF